MRFTYNLQHERNEVHKQIVLHIKVPSKGEGWVRIHARVWIRSSFKGDKRLHSSRSNIPLQMLHNSLIFFHFPVQKGILNWIWGFGNEPERLVQKVRGVELLWSQHQNDISAKERENILPTALSFSSSKEEKSENLQNNVNHSFDTQGGEVTQGCPHTG